MSSKPKPTKHRIYSVHGCTVWQPTWMHPGTHYVDLIEDAFFIVGKHDVKTLDEIGGIPIIKKLKKKKVKNEKPVKR